MSVWRTIKTVFRYIFNRKSIKEPKVLNLRTVKYFVQGHIRQMGKNFGIIEPYILEQAQWREEQVKKNSPNCLKEEKCVFCECSIQESLLSDPECVHGCFPEMLSSEDWQTFKQQNKITFDGNI